MRPRPALPILFALALLLPSCGGVAPSAPDPLGNDLTLGERRWRSARIESYTYRFRWSCFCTSDYVRTVDIRVRDGAVVWATDVETHEVLSEAALSRYRTIDDLFAMVRDAESGGAARIAITYDSRLGYPVDGYIDYQAGLADDEMGFHIERLVVSSFPRFRSGATQ